MPNDIINLLVTFDENYLEPFWTMLNSVSINNPAERFQVFLLHSSISQEKTNWLIEKCAGLNIRLILLPVDRSLFQSAPLTERYPQEMYYRLLAPCLLPEGLERVIYLDPDILVINPLRPLWEMDLKGSIFAAASHVGVIDIMNGINRIRLDTGHDYYNTGVMLIDLNKARTLVNPDVIFNSVREHAAELLLPDQDIFNYLYGELTMPLKDEIWNYDTRYFSGYLLRSWGAYTMSWVMQNTVILHFCGKRKPWIDDYTKPFDSLYKHYMRLAKREYYNSIS
ncbi:glycosyltransferase family 8 protein [Murimonas intestini]|uniref:Lipopolysaccharide biosynthesis glycosyltransferase n=1 Tax=Murimonas intestini TaxID=1337051 RepID=A0AB73TAK2_9FIRM|nr:glycosyltransferase family 8 protein [Murimonas intestini]MCR1838975.1 glycosyltransferase family 8 protein [Murimonas intestini]MCR1864271.1 glycosyltransferase family 8 protein [Murimonas intestini]MCR1881881.1 glycosyltransferase family 8 protein [Murimonas intestini]